MALAADKPAAPAAAEPVQMEWEKACADDIKTLCQATTGDVRACLAEHEKQLSKQCTKHFSAAGYRVALVCDADFDRLCAKEAAAGQLPKCIEAKQAQLSPKCKAVLTKASAQEEKKSAAKAADPAAPAPAKKARTKTK